MTSDDMSRIMHVLERSCSIKSTDDSDAYCGLVNNQNMGDDDNIVEIICENNNEYIDESVVVREKKIIPDQPKENENDNREYKLFLEFSGCSRKFEHRSTQLLNRLILGEGKALYLIGIHDDGRTEGITIDILYNSINNMCKMANNIGGHIKRVAIYDTARVGYYVATIRLELPDDVDNDMFVI